MIELNLNGSDYALPNDAKEVRLADFNKIYKISQLKDVGYFEKHLKIFELFGIPYHQWDDISEEKIVELIAEFNKVKVDGSVLCNKVEVNGRTYTAFEDEFVFKARDLVEIERAALKQVDNFPAYILGILFKDDNLTRIEHYVESHIKHKASLFAEHLTSDIAIPYLSLVAKRTLKNIQSA